MRAWRWGWVLVVLTGSAAAQQVTLDLESDRLGLEFDEAMQVVDNAPANAFVRLTPARRMDCSWSDDTSLECYFEEQAPLATRFRVELLPGLRTVEGKPVGGRVFDGTTARPELEARIDGWEAGVPKIVLDSEHRIVAADAAAVLRLTIDGKPVPVKLRAAHRRWEGDEGSVYELVLPQAAPDALLELAIIPGLRAQDGPLHGKQARTLLLARVNEPFGLRNAVCAGAKTPILATVVDGRIALDGCVPGEPIRLQFSRPLDKGSCEAWIARDSAINACTSGDEWDSRTRGDLSKREPARSPGGWIEFEVSAASAEVPLDLSGLRAVDGAGPATPVHGRISTVAARPQLLASHARALLADPATPVMQARNMPAEQLDVQVLSSKRSRISVDTPAAGDSPIDIALPAARRALDAGGVARIGVSGIGLDDAAIWAAAPDFDVYTIADSGALLVWANAWGTGDAIADARVDLLQADGEDGFEVLAAGRTGPDGVASLPLDRIPDMVAGDGKAPPLFVRVQQGGHRGSARAILPLELSAWDRRNVAAGGRRAREWGVADRPLYHAGDNVRWRVWQRKIGPQGYRAPAAGSAFDLALTDDRGHELLRWPATLDAFGAASGETRIPEHAPDGRYCIGRSTYNDIVCFRVGDFRPQDLWLRASAPPQMLSPDAPLRFDVEAGYYSGGSAAGVAIDHIQARLRKAHVGDVHKAFAAYEFGSDKSGGWASLRDAGQLRLTADVHGRARGVLPIAFTDGQEVPDFGLLQLTAEASLSDRESTTSNTVEVPYAAHASYVGLKLDPAWIDGESPVRMEGVVVTAGGELLAGADIDVEVSFHEDAKAAGTVLHRCRLRAGQGTDCSFPRQRTGLYRVSARSGDAFAAQVDRYVWTRWSRGAGNENPRLQQVGADVARGEPLRLLVQQRQPGARMLLVVQHQGQVLDHRVVALDGPSQVVDLPTSTGWPGQVRLSGYIRGDDDKAQVAAGYRQPVPVEKVQLNIGFIVRESGMPPVALAFEPTRTSPGGSARIELRNNGSEARSVVLTVMDDALHALGAEYMEEMDPAGEAWARAGAGYSYAISRGFDRWNAGSWRWRMPTAEELAVCDGRAAVDREACRKKLRAALGRRQVDIAWIASTYNGTSSQAMPARSRAQPIDVGSVESTAILTSEQVAALPYSRDTTSVALLAPGTTTASAPAAAGDGASLDSVSVVGNSISGDDPRAPVPDTRDPATKAAQPLLTVLTAPLDATRVRVNFSQTALWRNDIVLAPGETRVVQFVAPDNLTRWRAIAWSNTVGDDFAKAEATLEAGLPVEARLQSPVRVYPGDRTRVAVNVRHVADHPATADAFLRVATDAGVDPHQARLYLAPQGQSSFGVTLAPERPGAWELTAGAVTGDGRDAIALPLEVASPTIAAHRTQAGWLGTAPVLLDLPSLPGSASNPHLELSIWRGNTALVHGWTDDLRNYPHRCWEQILSRAVAAALAVERNDPAWPDAKVVVQEAIDNAMLFQEDDGGMRYFAEAPWYGDVGERTSAALTAYTLDAFEVLRNLGHEPPPLVVEGTRKYLQQQNAGGVMDRAFAAAALPQSSTVLDQLWNDWTRLPLPARIASARALARDGSAHATEAFTSLLQAAPRRGEARVVRTDEAWDRWMGSALREQCSLIRLYGDFPQFAPPDARRQLQAGLSDLYGGGIARVGTQEGAICLLALRDAKSHGEAPVTVDATLSSRRKILQLAAGEQHATASFDAAHGALSLASAKSVDAPIAYLAHITFEEDAREAESSAIGFSIERRYEVLRAYRWTPLATAGPLRHNDWLRITLVVSNSRERHFVAVTDDLPGGLRPVELALAGVAGIDVQALGDNGDWAFEQRRLDPRQPKFYAEHLWPGRHEIHYFARVANTGDYLAAPATAELMYGETTRARTAVARIRIADPEKTPAP
jgi:uncharacterized protein YfaS (alpha-2-macroglobulin family)